MTKLYKSKEIESSFIEILESKKKNTIVGCIYKHPNIHVGEFTNDFLKLSFGEDLKRFNWNEALTLSKENSNSSFKAFLNIVDRLIDKHGPKTPIPKTKRQTKSKPWITPALSNSMKIKNRIYKQFCKANDVIKKKLHEWFKNYRNLTNTLTRVCKEECYKSFFQDNKKDSKKYGKV